MAVGVLLTVIVLYPTLRETMREQKYGLLLSPEEVKATCGKPQQDDIFKFTYVDTERRVELQFMAVDHRMYLNNVKWSATKGGVGSIDKVSRDLISEHVKVGGLPACLEAAAQ